MIVLMDIGNSRLKWAAGDGSGALRPEALVHDGRPADLIAKLELPAAEAAAEAVWISQVLGSDAEGPLSDAVRERWNVAPQFARTREESHGLRVAYDEPERLGVDRWLAMLKLWHAIGSGFCVVNAGTALTFDTVDEFGQHLGGLIAPGLATAQKAVGGATRFEIRPQPTRYKSGLGKDTESCVRQGALYACAGLIERAVQQVAGGRYVTGGDAEALLPHIGRGWDWRPNLVLEGLRLLATE